MNILQLIIWPVAALIIGVFLLGLARRFMARVQWRCGPPLYQPIIDIVRQFTQRSVTHGHVFELGVLLSLAGSLISVLFLPFGAKAPLAGSGGMIVILYLMLLGPLGIALSAGEAANPLASIGISRKLMLAMGYEVPFLLIILAIMTHYGTISLSDIVSAQREARSAIATFPLVLSGVAYLLVLPAMLGVRPFEVVGAVQEISAGPVVEYGGPLLALVTIQHGLNMFIALSLFVNLLWGGAGNPAVFLLKMLAVFALCFWVNASFPRLRIDQAIRYLWRWPTLIAFAGLILAATVGR